MQHIPYRVIQLWGFKPVNAPASARRSSHSSEPPAETIPDTRVTRSWRDKNPGIDYRCYGPAASRRLIADKYPQYLRAYDGYSEWVERCDFARLVWLYELGGIYADMDTECLVPVREWHEHEPGLRTAQGAFGPDLKVSMVNNWCIAAAPQLPLLKFILDDLATHARSDSGRAWVTMLAVLKNTGPMAVTRAFSRAPAALKQGVLRFQTHVFGSMSPPRGYRRLVEHHFTSSWMPMKATTIFSALRWTAIIGAIAAALLLVFLVWVLLRRRNARRAAAALSVTGSSPTII
jgi:mannosyltransferase OCH1-like enzyme